jgi:signal transduction histidine kinase
VSSAADPLAAADAPGGAAVPPTRVDPDRRTPRLVSLVLGSGLGIGLVLARAVGASWSEALVCLGLAVLGSAVVVAATVVALRWLRGRSITGHLFVVALGGVAATAAGVGLAAWAMFLSTHDLGVLAVVLVVSGTVAATASWTMAQSFRRSVDALTRQVDALRGDRPLPADTDVAIGEMRHLSGTMAAAHAELVAARQLTARLEGSRRELVSWVSHDLRSPIGAVRAMAEALEDGVVTDAHDVAGYHRAILQETERLARLVDDLFELSRLEAGYAALDVSLLPVDQLLGKVVEAARVRADAHGVTLVAHLAGMAPGPVMAGDVRRAIDNVVDNAIRHTPRGGSVELRASPAGTWVELVVADQCGGIPDADLDRIFEVAFRGDASRSRDTGGGGLGLAIAKSLLEARAGRLTVRNESSGCRFTLRLPTTVVP